MSKKHFVGIAALVLVVLWGFGRMVSNSAHGGASRGYHAGGNTTAAPGDKWQVEEDRSPMDDSKTVVLRLDSDDMVRGPIEARKPSLIIRCKEGKTDVYVVTGMAANVEKGFEGGPSDDHSVRVRLDEGPVSYYSWSESTDHKALFASDLIYDSNGHISAFSGGAAVFGKKIASAKTLTFEFTPFDGSPQVARFDVRGVDNHLDKVAEACHWHVDELGQRY